MVTTIRTTGRFFPDFSNILSHCSVSCRLISLPLNRLQSLLCYSAPKHLSTFQKCCLCFIYNDSAVAHAIEGGYKWCDGAVLKRL